MQDHRCAKNRLKRRNRSALTMTKFVPSGYLSIRDALDRLGRELFPSAWTGEEQKARRGLISEEEWLKNKDSPRRVVLERAVAGEAGRRRQRRPRRIRATILPTLCTRRSTGRGSGRWKHIIGCENYSRPVGSRRPYWILGAGNCTEPRLHCGVGSMPIG